MKLPAVKWITIAIGVLMAALVIGLSGCKVHERLVTKTEYRDRVQHDSLKLVVKDSVYIREKGDTVTVYKLRTIEKNTVRIQKDTVSRTDTVVSPPVVRTKTVKVKNGYYYLGLYGVWALIAYVLYKVSKIPVVQSKFQLLLKLLKLK